MLVPSPLAAAGPHAVATLHAWVRGARYVVACAAWVCTLALTSCALAPPAAVAPVVPPAPPSGWEWPTAEVAEWRAVPLPGRRPTQYQFEPLGDPSLMLLRATADRSASMWRRAVTRPPGAPVRLRFAWWIPEPLPGARVGDIDLDDAPVRIVLAFDGDHARLALRDQLLFDLVQTLTGERPPYASLVYVWDARTQREEVVMNARTDRVRSIVVDSGPDGLRSWRLHRRDVVADFVRAFGEAPGPLMGLAVMTDTDNTLVRTHAWYGLVALE